MNSSAPTFWTTSPWQAEQYVRIPKVFEAPLPAELGEQEAIGPVDPEQHSVLFHKIHGEVQEIVWYRRESPRQRYGAGVLYADGTADDPVPPAPTRP